MNSMFQAVIGFARNFMIKLRCLLSRFFGACMGQKCQFWDTLGHDWDTITYTNFAELHMILFFNVLNTLEKANALGRSLVISKIALSRS